MITRSSAKNSSQGTPTLKSLDCDYSSDDINLSSDDNNL